MPPALKYVLDALAGAALLCALLLVFFVDHLLKPRPSGPAVNTLQVEFVADAPKSVAKPLKLAVTPTGTGKSLDNQEIVLWDDMGKLLREMGDRYKFDVLQTNEIRDNPQKLAEYDVLFLTCAPGGEDLHEALRAYVSNGGILYASDWRYDAVAAAFKDMRDDAAFGKGYKQEFEADVVDPALREAIGSNKIHLRFDLPEWKTAAFGGPRVKTLIRGTYRKQDPFNPLNPPQEAVAPLMVEFPFGKGTVLFTSFHNEKQNSEDEKKLLQFLVFRLVTAKVDNQVNEKMNELGFTPQRSNLLSTARDKPSVTKTYEHKQPGTLRFTLGFNNEGAKLRFNIKSPDNQEFTKDADSTLSLQVPNAKVGTWTYTVTALEGAENFPFRVTVGEKK